MRRRSTRWPLAALGLMALALTAPLLQSCSKDEAPLVRTPKTVSNDLRGLSEKLVEFSEAQKLLTPQES